MCNRQYEDITNDSEFAAIIEMFIFQPNKVPNEPTEDLQWPQKSGNKITICNFKHNQKEGYNPGHSQ